MRVAIVGAGTVGAQAALQLAEAGAEVDVFDRFNAPHPWGAHAGESRLLRSVPYLETAPGDRDIIRASIPAWRRLEERSGRPLLTACGGLILGDPSSEAFSLAAESGGVARYSTVELGEAFPQFEITDDEGLFDGEGGLVDPQHAVIAALELAVRAGARVHQRARVTEVGSTGRGAELVVAGSETLRFDRVVVAAGAFARELLPAAPIYSRRLLLGWFDPRDGRAGLRDGMPAFFWAPSPGSFLYGGPSEDGRTVKVGVEAPLGEVEDAAWGRAVSDSDTALMREYVRRYLPWLDEGSGRYEMHIDGWSRDGHGLLGEVPGSPGVVAAVGWTGHGFKISPILGEILRDVVLEREPGYDISHLDPGRF